MVTVFQFDCGCVDVGDSAKVEKGLVWDSGVCLSFSCSFYISILLGNHLAFSLLGSGRNLIVAILECAALKCKPS